MTVEEAMALLDTILPKPLNDLHTFVFQQTWQGKTYTAMADISAYDENYLKSIGSSIWKSLSQALNQNVTKSNIHSCLEAYARQYGREVSDLPTTPGTVSVPSRREALNQPTLVHFTAPLEPDQTQPYQDWGEVMDVSVFFGRTGELATLHHWITNDHCRLIAVLGMGGIGKSALTVKLAEQVIRDQGDGTSPFSQFRYFIWRSLRNAPTLASLLADILQFLSNQREIEASLPRNTPDRIARLLYYLRQARCLLLLDNVETLLQGGELSGIYREGYEEYGDLFQRLGETRHQSCVVITSREKPKEITVLEGEGSPVRSFALAGLGEPEGQALLEQRGAFVASQDEWQQLVQHYAGNPLALKMVAAAMDELFGGGVSEFLEYIQAHKHSLIFGDIRDLLERQFERLSALEQEVMYWLAINRELVSLSELSNDIVSTQAQLQLPETLRSLSRRNLIESATLTRTLPQTASFSQQPVVMEFVTEKLIAQVVQEIITQQFDIFMGHALMKATAKDYICQSQIRVILSPILARLQTTNISKSLQSLLKEVLDTLHQHYMGVPGYGAGNLINCLRQLNTDFSHYDFSGLAVWQANLQDLILHKVNFENADLRKSLFSETLGGVFRVAFSEDSQWLALGDSNGEISVRQVQDGELLMSWRGHEGVMCGMAFSPDKKFLATASCHIVKLWQIPDNTVPAFQQAGTTRELGTPLWLRQTASLVRTWTDHTGWIRELAFSPDGQLLATVGNEDQTLRIWDITTRDCRYILRDHEGPVLSCAFHPFQSLVVSGSSDQTIKFWDTRTGTCLQTWVGQNHHIWSIAFSPDGQILATGDGGGTIKIWDMDTGECYLTLLGHIGLVYSLSIRADGQVMASGASEGTVRIWDLNTGQCLRVLQGHANDVFDVCFSPDGDTLVSGSFDHTVKFWDTQQWHCQRTWRGYSNGFCSLVGLSADSLLTGSGDGYIRFWDLKTGRCLRKISGHQGFAWSVAVSPTRQWFASAGEDALIKLWDIDTGQCCKVLRGHLSAIQAIAFSPLTEGMSNADNGMGYLVSASSDGTVKLWDVTTGICIRTLTGHRSRVWGLAVHPHGQMIASGSFDHTVRIWQGDSLFTAEPEKGILPAEYSPVSDDEGDCLIVLDEHTHWMWGVAFSPDGTQLATASGDHTIKLWDTQTWTCLHTLEGHTSWVQSVAFSPEGNSLVSGSVDTTVKIWDVRTGDCCQTLCGHSNWIYAVIFAKDGQTIISSCQDETLKIWDVRTGSCLRTLKADRLYEGMNLVGAKGLSDSQKLALSVLGAVI
jgi:WD40 repeat protein